jgi:hypothetical protein
VSIYSFLWHCSFCVMHFLALSGFEAQAFGSSLILFLYGCRVARYHSEVLEFHLESVHHQE